MQVSNLLGADIVAHENGAVDVVGTDYGFPVRSLVRGKGKCDDWANDCFC